MADKPWIAAQVVLATAASDGRLITSQNVHEAQAPKDVAQRVVDALSDLGFKTGPVVGNSFSIEATSAVFEKIFGVRPALADDGSARNKGMPGSAPLTELPIGELPAALRPHVQAIVFSAPPAFGPGTLP